MKKFVYLILGVVFTGLIIGTIFASSTMANTNIEVQTCEVPGDYISIQEAVDAPECSLVNVGNGTFIENVTITRTVTVQGQGPANTIVNGSGIDDVFNIQATTEMSQSVAITVTLSDMTITNGDTGIYSEAYNENPDPGYGRATIHLDIVNCAVSDNSSSGIHNSAGDSGHTEVHVIDSAIGGNSGHGVYNSSYFGQTRVNVVDSTISDNSGRGISNYGHTTGIVRVIDSTISGNTGGGIHSGEGGRLGSFTHAEVYVTGSTVSGNSAQNGGGVLNVGYSRLYVHNSTISGNTATELGGGIANGSGHIEITSSTLSGNEAGSGGGIYDTWCDGPYCGYGGAEVSNTVVANSLSGGDCVAYYDAGYNIIEDGSCISAATSSSGDPMLGPLQNNGGRTLTHALLPDSQAMDAGDNATCPDTDQRGYPRPVDGDKDGTDVCDIGAYEYIKFIDFSYFPAVLK